MQYSGIWCFFKAWMIFNLPHSLFLNLPLANDRAYRSSSSSFFGDHG
jgi:hypothetical protein